MWSATSPEASEKYAMLAPSGDHAGDRSWAPGVPVMTRGSPLTGGTVTISPRKSKTALAPDGDMAADWMNSSPEAQRGRVSMRSAATRSATGSRRRPPGRRRAGPRPARRPPRCRRPGRPGSGSPRARSVAAPCRLRPDRVPGVSRNPDSTSAFGRSVASGCTAWSRRSYERHPRGFSSALGWPLDGGGLSAGRSRPGSAPANRRRRPRAETACPPRAPAAGRSRPGRPWRSRCRGKPRRWRCRAGCS